MRKTLILGATVVDVILRLPRLPQSQESCNIYHQELRLGGCAFNAFRAAQVTGAAPCVLASPVGTGVWGEGVQAALTERGIVPAIPRPEEPNGCCYCLVTPDGERSFLCEHGAEYRFRREWLDALPQDVSAVYLCGLEVEEATGDTLLDWLEAHPPRRLLFSPGPRLCRIPPRKMARILAMTPLMHLSEVEAAQFTRTDDPAEAAALLRRISGGDVVITLGDRGAYCLGAEGGELVSGYSARVVDTIGAGDSHAGAVMAALAEGLSLPEAVRRANRVAAAVVSQAGAELNPYVWRKVCQEG